jgi:hypothetical protein
MPNVSEVILIIPDFIDGQMGSSEGVVLAANQLNSRLLAPCWFGNVAPTKIGECREDPSSLDGGPSSSDMLCEKGEYGLVLALTAILKGQKKGPGREGLAHGIQLDSFRECHAI